MDAVGVDFPDACQKQILPHVLVSFSQETLLIRWISGFSCA
jgi:hypothetical protein